MTRLLHYSKKVYAKKASIVFQKKKKNSDVYNVHAVKGKCGILIVQEKNGENVPICVGIIIISIIVYFLPRVFWSVLGHDWWFKDFKGGWIRPCHSLQRSTHSTTIEVF